MTKQDNGGPAFPIYTDDMPVEGSPGISYLDYAAINAMQGICSKSIPEPHNNAADIALESYEIATAMLAEKHRREEG